jgi:hypothetical protein
VANLLPPADGVSPDAAYLGRCILTAAAMVCAEIDSALCDPDGTTLLDNTARIAEAVEAVAETLEERSHA